MIEIISERNIKNCEVINKELLNDFLAKDDTKIYEVIRVIGSKPVFLREHFDRIIKSLQLCGLRKSIDFEYFKKSILMLIKENSFENCNIRVSYYEKEEQVLLMYYIKSSYPEDIIYTKGIDVITIKKQRKNPNAKSYEVGLRSSIDEILLKSKAFEAVLINENETVSEGSKSNIFFVKDNKLITSPDSDVLLGVTRSKILKTCQASGICVEKRRISTDELKNLDASFLTGTSINVLPINILDDIEYASQNNKMVKKIGQMYLNEMKK